MEELNRLRLDRIKNIDLSYDYIKKIVKKNFDYELKEQNLDEFVANIDTYKTLDEDMLMVLLEKYSYRKLNIYSIKQLTRQKECPISNELLSPINKQLFAHKNRISLSDNDFYYDGELDSCYKIVYYHEDNNYIEIKLACQKEFSYQTIDDLNGAITELSETIYDCAKFIIDLEKNLVFMFYNDVLHQGIDHFGKDRKTSFCRLFNDVTVRNLVAYSIAQNLENYFTDYLSELEANDPRKLISIIETKNVLGKSNSLKSICSDYNHSKPRIDAMQYAIENEQHIINTIECKINDSLVKLKALGEVSLTKDVFEVEVMKNVCKEFFSSYNPMFTESRV